MDFLSTVSSIFLYKEFQLLAYRLGIISLIQIYVEDITL